MLRVINKPLLFALLLAGLLHTGFAKAETLREAMIKAYETSSTLQAARAKLRNVDEGVAIAKSGARPNADFTASIAQQVTDFNNVQTDFTPRQFGATVTQPLYKGGQIDAGIDSAENKVKQERAVLIDAEQTLFLSVAQVYHDVLRDQALVELTKKTEQVLQKELQAARDRLKVGEATRTDVSQAVSRLSGANADRINAEGKLAINKATYERIIGAPPAKLVRDGLTPNLPKTLDESLKIAEGNSPTVIAAQYAMAAAENDIDAAQGALLPDIAFEASGTRGYDLSSAALGETSTAKIMARLTMPIYRGGADYAKTRAAKETASQRRLEVRKSLKAVRENVTRAWQQLTTTKAAINARKKQVEAAGLAYEGVRQESEVGTRTILDRLNAEAEKLQAHVDLVQAERDEAVAMFDLKAAIGELTATQLALNTKIYNSEEHYDSVKDSWLGLKAWDERNNSPAPETAFPEQKIPENKPDEENGWFDDVLGSVW